MTIVGTAEVAVTPQLKNFEKDVRTGVSQAFKGADVEANKAGKAIGASFSSGFTAVFGAVAFGQILRSSLGEADEALKVAALTEAVLKSTGAVAGVSAEQVATLADELSRLAGVDDDVIQGAENVLLTFTKVRNAVGEGNDVFSQAITAAVDLSAALGTDLQGSVIQLGKALNDPVKGVTALQRVGVSFTEAQRDQIKELVKSNRLLDAQKIILRELQTEFGGAAEAAATPLARFNVAVGELQETIGRGLTPVVEDLTGFLTGALDLFEHLPEPIRNTVIQVAALGLGIKAVNTFSRALLGVDLIRFFTSLAPAAAAAATSIELVGVAATAAEAGLAAAALGIGALVAPLAAAGLAAGVAINKIAELGETDNIKELADRDLEAVLQALKRVGATTPELQAVGDVISQFIQDGKLTATTVDDVSQNLSLLLAIARDGGDLVAAFTAILNHDTAALADLNAAYGIAAGGAGKLADATGKLTKEQEQAADARKRLNRAIRDGEQAVDSAEERLRRAREDGQKRIDQANKDIVQAIEDRNEARKDAAKELADVEEESAERVAEAERNLVRVRRERIVAIGDAQIALERARASGDADAENAAEIALKQAQNNNNVKDAERSLADAREQQIERTAEAQEHLADVYEDTAKRIAEAFQNLADAREQSDRSVTDAENALAEAQERQRDSVDDAIENWQKYKIEIDDVAEHVDVLTDKVRDLRDILTDPVFQPKPEPSSGDPLEDIFNSPLRKAGGGGIPAGRWSWVGEEGPELVRSGAGGSFVTSNDDIAAVLRQMIAGGGSSNAGVTQHISVSGMDPRVLVNELRFMLMHGVTS